MNVLSPCLLEELIEDIGDSHFSLIIDESTMIDITKVMCVMVRYFSKKFQKVRTTFYRFIELNSGTAKIMTNCLKKQLEDDKLKLKNLIGIGIDGANPMAGPNNSVSSRLTEEVPHLVTVKCVAHSLHLCAEKAFEILPKNLDFLVKKSYSWFAKSTKRIIEYEKLYTTMGENNPQKITKLSGTRWLARLKAIETILNQWDVLKLHFQLMSTTEKGDSGFKAQMLFQMYSDHQNKLFLIFLRHSLKKVITTNMLFQSESAEPLKLLKDLNELLYSTLQKIVVPQQLSKASTQNQELCHFKFQNHLMVVNCVDYGHEFNADSNKVDSKVLFYIKERCRDFLVKLAEELQLRVPKNVKILERISVFTPIKASSQIKENICEIAQTFKTICEDIDETVEEWNLLHRVEVSSDDMNSSEKYWAVISSITDASGEPRFKHISELAKAVLALPISNASVERAFSVANIVKDKLRNRMATKTADAIMRVRFLLSVSCAKMLNMFKSENVYKAEFAEEVLDAFSKTDQ